LSYPAYLDFRDRNRAFEGLAANDTLGRKIRLAHREAIEMIDGEGVSDNYFSVLGVGMRAGRYFRADESQTSGSQPVAVISYNLWQRAFDGQANVLGRTVSLNGQPFTIIGIAPRGFHGTRLNGNVDVWFPLTLHPLVATAGESGPSLQDRDSQWIRITGRLKQNTTAEQALAELRSIGRQLEVEFPNTDKWEFEALAPAASLVVGDRLDDLNRFVWMLVGVVGFALLIACANVANLLLARSEARRKEIGVRMALGAGRFRLVRQLLTESLLLSLLGGVAGLLVAMWAMDLLRAFELPGRVQIEALSLELDLQVLGFSLLLSVSTGVVFGIAPALAASRPDIVAVLKGSDSGRAAGKQWLRGSFVIAQIAISLVLLIGGGLFVKSLRQALAVDTGFDGGPVAIASVDLGVQGYNPSQAENFYAQTLERVRSLPGVTSASWASFVPVQRRAFMEDFTVEGYQPQPGEESSFFMNFVSTGYFQTLGIPLLRGRDFNDRDVAGSTRVAIVNEEFARRYFSGGDAMGRRIRIGTEGPFLEVIAVARDSKYRSLDEEALPYIYAPLAQYIRAMGLREVKLIARSAGDPVGLIAPMRRAIGESDSQIAVFGAMTWRDHIGDLMRTQEMGATLLGFFSLIALALTAVGLYGVMSYSISRRTQEIGIRQALGADRWDILKLVVRQGLTLTVIGVVIGLLAALLLTRFLSSLLFGVEPDDALTFAGVSALLIVVALLACYVPARRAAKVDPMVALRYE
ncbi:MAG: ABC transporter permease, partial [Blastocatellia bacterium]|nr:ABC transporter permease [Blastocatellia bacterium]